MSVIFMVPLKPFPATIILFSASQAINYTLQSPETIITLLGDNRDNNEDHNRVLLRHNIVVRIKTSKNILLRHLLGLPKATINEAS